MNTRHLLTVAGLVNATGAPYGAALAALKRANVEPAQTLDGRAYYDEAAIAAVRDELRTVTVERAVAVDPIPRNNTPGHPGGLELR